MNDHHSRAWKKQKMTDAIYAKYEHESKAHKFGLGILEFCCAHLDSDKLVDEWCQLYYDEGKALPVLLSDLKSAAREIMDAMNEESKR